MYGWMIQPLSKWKKALERLLKKDYKDDFFARFKTNMLTALEKYNDKYQFARNNRSDKVNETLAEAYMAAHAALINHRMTQKKPTLKGIARLEPIDMEELIAFFNAKLDDQFYDIRYTMEKDKNKAKIVDEFFEEIGKEFTHANKSVIEKISKKEKLSAVSSLMHTYNKRLTGSLRDSAIKVAREYYENYPFEVYQYLLKENELDFVMTMEADNTRVANGYPSKSMKMELLLF
jgi:hypothetical protein